MLAFLHIRNLATVSELEMEFAPGLNAITGETGTGKSVIMGALQALLGERAGKSIIRHGEKRCEIAAELALPESVPELTDRLARILDDAGVAPCRDERLRLRRVITPSSSRAYINDSLATLDVLQAVGNLLVDIHGPHDHQSLLGSACQLDLLDAFAELHERRRSCAETYQEEQECRREIDELRNLTVDQAEREILTHQLREIQQAELDPKEEQRLQEQYRTAANARDLIENANSCRQLLSENDESAVERLRPAVGKLEEMERLGGGDAAEFRERLEGVISQLDDLSGELTDFADRIELDGAELHQIESRLDEIQRLRRKYGGTVESALDRAQQLSERLNATEQRDERLQELNSRRTELQKEHQKWCAELTEQRREAAGELAEKIQEKLQNLGFADSRFHIEVAEKTPDSKGADRVEFNFAPNPGEGMLPLRKIVSSGEMARIMLGIKTVFTAVDQIPVLVFDEVDANIGGRTANQVARELGRIGSRHQIFCITHLPQIAAVATSHYRVDKNNFAGRTITEMQELDTEPRLHEIVRMMGGDENSETARRHARNMISTGSGNP